MFIVRKKFSGLQEQLNRSQNPSFLIFLRADTFTAWLFVQPLPSLGSEILGHKTIELFRQ